MSNFPFTKVRKDENKNHRPQLKSENERIRKKSIQMSGYKYLLLTLVPTHRLDIDKGSCVWWHRRRRDERREKSFAVELNFSDSVKIFSRLLRLMKLHAGKQKEEKKIWLLRLSFGTTLAFLLFITIFLSHFNLSSYTVSKLGASRFICELRDGNTFSSRDKLGKKYHRDVLVLNYIFL